MIAAAVAAAIVVAALGSTWLVLRHRSRQRDADRRFASEVDAAIERFRAETGRAQLDRAAQDRKIIEEESLREPPNADLPRDSRDALRERLLRAARASGGDEARSRLEQLLPPPGSSEP